MGNCENCRQFLLLVINVSIFVWLNYIMWHKIWIALKMCLKVLYRIGEDKKHCLISVWKLTNYAVHTSTIFFCEIFPSKSNHFPKICIWKHERRKKKHAISWFRLLKPKLRTMCLHAENCTWFFTIFFRLTQCFNPKFVKVYFMHMVDHTKHEHCLWPFCQLYQSCKTPFKKRTKRKPTKISFQTI